MKYAMDTPFAIFKQLPRQALPVDDESRLQSLVGVGLAVEEYRDFPDPLSYLEHYEVSIIIMPCLLCNRVFLPYRMITVRRLKMC